MRPFLLTALPKRVRFQSYDLWESQRGACPSAALLTSSTIQWGVLLFRCSERLQPEGATDRAVRKRGSYWWYDFRCNIHKTRHRASLREARTKAQAEQAEANKRLECFGVAYGSAQRQTPKLS